MRAITTGLMASIVIMIVTGVQAQPAGSRVLVISVDGLRPDLILEADCPTLRGMMRRGSFSLHAVTVPEAKTLPAHVSMMTGRHVKHHGIDWNDDDPPFWVDYRYPRAPTLFDLASRHGYSTAIVAGKRRLDTLARPGSVGLLSLPVESTRVDPATTAVATAIIRTYAPQVMLLHLASVDTVGHDKEWGSEEQLQAISRADACIGRVLDALNKRGVLDETLVIVTSDHGGFGRTHHGDDPRGLRIPWIAVGPGVEAGLDLAASGGRTIHVEDTFVTACAFLRIAPPDPYEGRRLFDDE